jgi:hypothetical protein
MLEETKLQQWWNSLPENHKTYLKNQPLWHDRDMYKAVAVGIVIGVIIGLIVGYDLGLPDPSLYQPRFLRG